jgi:serine/threonine protein kinase
MPDKKHKHIGYDPLKLANLWKMGSERGGIDDSISQIGNYNIIRQIGEGGFGYVYLADQQQPIKRQVAIKIIKPGMDSKQVIARFEAERQTLALLDHSNIAHIYEAGTTESGKPYFVMEYIKGMPITEYCDHHRLKIEERLKLFIQVCEAVQHAHQKGIIHRDIKPSNIIVSVQDGKAIPKVIDFGIAKAINMPLTGKTMFTQQGQLVGTPEYMSPEQADCKERDIDTRTDIYSLGVILYELLSGTLPFAPETLREAGFAKIQQIIREQEPRRPSTQLSSLGNDAAKVAQNRCTELSILVRNLHKELEWIPLKAIRKERDQRYKKASDLAEDIANYLNGKPLTAGPESKIYRAKKFIKRNRKLILTAVLVTITTVIIMSSIFIIVTKKQQNINIASKRGLESTTTIPPTAPNRNDNKLLTKDAGLKGYWSFDEGKGDIAHDNVGGNNGIISGAMWTTGISGAALSFDGRDDYIAVPDSSALNPSNMISVATWIKITSFPTRWMPIVTKSYWDSGYYGKSGSTTQGYVLEFTIDNTGLLFVIDGPGDTGVRSNVMPIQMDTWTFVTGVYDGYSVNLYINGVPSTPVYGSVSTWSSPADLYIGRSAAVPDRYFNGQIDSVRIYDRALTSAEIQHLMQIDSNPEPVGMAWVTITDPGVSGHGGFKGQMSKYETTNVQYCQFLNAALSSGDITVDGFYVKGFKGLNPGTDFVGQVYYDLNGAGFTTDNANFGGAARISFNNGVFTVDAGFENHPVTYVSWYGSDAFCKYYGLRLPFEWEWQAVADYDGSYEYGYGPGNGIYNSRANYRGSDHPDGTTAVGAFGTTHSYELCDMAGNVFEWTNSCWSNSDCMHMVIRGGGWNDVESWCSISKRNNQAKDGYSYGLGFRACR